MLERLLTKTRSLSLWLTWLGGSLIDEDEDETENEHIISSGIILAAIFVPLLYSTEKKVHKSIRHK